MKNNSVIDLAGISLASPLMNGAYIGSKTFENVEDLAKSASGAVVVGSISVKPRKQNSGRGYWLHKDGFYSLNSYGMPNGGLPYFQTKLPQMVEIVHSYKKPLIANVVGFNNDEFVELVKFAEQSGADMVELNLGCPNVWEHGKQERIVSYHASLVKQLLQDIAQLNPKIKISAKISPLPPDILQEVAYEIIASGIIHAVTATNSYPNASLSAGTKHEADPAALLAGLSGRSLKPISLGVVKQLRQILPDNIAIIGCGGVSSANDVNDYSGAGAAAVQIATGLVENGLELFSDIQSN